MSNIASMHESKTSRTYVLRNRLLIFHCNVHAKPRLATCDWKANSKTGEGLSVSMSQRPLVPLGIAMGIHGYERSGFTACDGKRFNASEAGIHSRRDGSPRMCETCCIHSLLAA